MVKKLLLLVLISSMVSAGGEEKKELPPEDPKTSCSGDQIKKNEGWKKIVEGSGSLEEAYARLMYTKQNEVKGDCVVQ
jgi:hypothetical protein